MSGKHCFEVKVILKRFFLRRDKILGVVLKAFGRTDLDSWGYFGRKNTCRIPEDCGID